jgi:uncharacterized protein YuzE
MEVKYDAKSDVMYIRLNHKKVHSNVTAADNSIVIDVAEDDTVVGIELISPSRYVENLDEMIFRRASQMVEAGK